MKIRRYSELKYLTTFEERFRYLKLLGNVGESTFGFDRYINQMFYQSKQWKTVRRDVIVRDEGRDLGIEGYEIHSKVIIHHMNPMAREDIQNAKLEILDPEFLICTSVLTHQAIHFGDESLLPKVPIERKSGDTTLW